ncbi:hypothetical protein DFS34DRAFT_597896 [Phlyctochytrium arcticum]|nr:hypothetical protein DFS34DRAFT_597896 [Phlyctochytrium arcticum]
MIIGLERRSFIVEKLGAKFVSSYTVLELVGVGELGSTSMPLWSPPTPKWVRPGSNDGAQRSCWPKNQVNWALMADINEVEMEELLKHSVKDNEPLFEKFGRPSLRGSSHATSANPVDPGISSQTVLISSKVLALLKEQLKTATAKSNASGIKIQYLESSLASSRSKEASLQLEMDRMKADHAKELNQLNVQFATINQQQANARSTTIKTLRQKCRQMELDAFRDQVARKKAENELRCLRAKLERQQEEQVIALVGQLEESIKAQYEEKSQMVENEQLLLLYKRAEMRDSSSQKRIHTLNQALRKSLIR